MAGAGASKVFAMQLAKQATVGAALATICAMGWKFFVMDRTHSKLVTYHNKHPAKHSE